MGIECNVDVDYRVTSVGSPTSYDIMYGADGGDPDEIEIDHIWIGGEDYKDKLSNCYAFETKYGYEGFSIRPIAYMNAEKHKEYKWQDKIRIAIFGLEPARFYADTFLPIQTKVNYNCCTIYEVLEGRILSSEALQDAIRDLDNQEW